MDADIKGALSQLNKSYRYFEHKGKSMTKQQVKQILEWGLIKGYKSVYQIPDEYIDKVITNNTLSVTNNTLFTTN